MLFESPRAGSMFPSSQLWFFIGSVLFFLVFPFEASAQSPTNLEIGRPEPLRVMLAVDDDAKAYLPALTKVVNHSGLILIDDSPTLLGNIARDRIREMGTRYPADMIIVTTFDPDSARVKCSAWLMPATKILAQIETQFDGDNLSQALSSITGRTLMEARVEAGGLLVYPVKIPSGWNEASISQLMDWLSRMKGVSHVTRSFSADGDVPRTISIISRLQRKQAWSDHLNEFKDGALVVELAIP